jgi:prolyl oligopeptidase
MLHSIRYPHTRQTDVSDDFFGTNVPDPYRWLENADDPEVLEWTQTQQDLAQEILGNLTGRDYFRTRLTHIWDYPKYGITRKRGNRLFFTKNEGLQAQPVLYVQEGELPPRQLLDPNTLSTDGTVSLNDWQPTVSGDKLMVAFAESGLDWVTFRVLDVTTATFLDDTLEKIKFSSATWLQDESGFYYSRFPDNTQDEGSDNQNVSHQLFFHRLGTAQTDDELIYEHPDLNGLIFESKISHDNRYLILQIYGDSFVYNRLYYRPLDSTTPFVRLFDDLDALYNFLGNDGDTFYIETSKNAPNKQIIAVNLATPHNWQTLIAESQDVIETVTIANQQFVVTTMHHAHNLIKIYDKYGVWQYDIPLPSIGSLGYFGGILSQPNDTEIFIPFMSFLQPLIVLKYDFLQKTLSPFFSVDVPSFNPDDYETQQVFCPSTDGATVPMFIVAKKGLALNANNPTILYGYGGYGVSLTPGYANWLPTWLESGGIFAWANLRGGGEYGETWHTDGMLDKKQHTFDDFHACAEWLISHQYTSNKKLAIEGGSNGGLMVATCMLQRPQLYGAVLCHVPVIDMLRFQHFTAGRYWTSEYGDANSSPEHFEFLYRYSPLHNVKNDATYPPILIMTADHDDRVVPMHSKKFVATLQATATPNRVALLRIETKAGHGFGKPTDKLIEERVDVMAFLNAVFEMGIR